MGNIYSPSKIGICTVQKGIVKIIIVRSKLGNIHSESLNSITENEQ